MGGTVARTKTTIDIPDALATKAKRLARAEGVSLRELVIGGLTEKIARRQSRPVVEFVFNSVDGEDLRPKAAGRPVSELAYDLRS